MKTPILGKDKILMFRRFADQATAAGRLALQVTHDVGESVELTTTQTKDGAIITPGGLETTISIEAISTRDPLNEMLREAMRKRELLEIWIIDFGAEPEVDETEGTSKYPAEYGQGYLNAWTVPDDVESHETISTEFNVNGELVKGMATVTAEQVDQVAYAFKDVVPSV